MAKEDIKVKDTGWTKICKPKQNYTTPLEFQSLLSWPKKFIARISLLPGQPIVVHQTTQG